MAGKYDINEVIELLFDDEFGLFGSEVSAEESEDAYHFLLIDKGIFNR